MFCIFLSLSLCQRESSRGNSPHPLRGSSPQRGEPRSGALLAPINRGEPEESGLVVAVGTEAGVRVEEHRLFDLVVVVATVILAEATVVDRLVERGATHHAFLKVTLAGSQAGVGTLTPSFQCGLTIGLGHGRLEGTRMDQSHEAGNMSEAERGGQTGLDRATSGLATELVLTTADAQGLPNPDHVVVALELRIHAVERRVRRNHAGLEQLRQTVDLEDAGTTLGVAGKRLLRDHEQRVAVGAADGVGQRVVQLGFVRVVGVGGCVGN